MQLASPKDRFPHPTTWSRLDAIEAFGVGYVHAGPWRSPIVETLGTRQPDPHSHAVCFPTEAAAVAHVRQAARDEAEREIARIEGILNAPSMRTRLALARSFRALRRNGIGILATESIFDHRRRECRAVLKNGISPEVRRLPDPVRLPIVLPIGLPAYVVDTRRFPDEPLRVRKDAIARRHLLEAPEHPDFDALVRYELAGTPGYLSYDLAAIARPTLQGLPPGMDVFLHAAMAEEQAEAYAETVRAKLSGQAGASPRAAATLLSLAPAAAPSLPHVPALAPEPTPVPAPAPEPDPVAAPAPPAGPPKAADPPAAALASPDAEGQPRLRASNARMLAVLAALPAREGPLPQPPAAHVAEGSEPIGKPIAKPVPAPAPEVARETPSEAEPTVPHAPAPSPDMAEAAVEAADTPLESLTQASEPAVDPDDAGAAPAVVLPEEPTVEAAAPEPLPVPEPVPPASASRQPSAEPDATAPSEADMPPPPSDLAVDPQGTDPVPDTAQPVPAPDESTPGAAEDTVPETGHVPDTAPSPPPAAIPDRPDLAVADLPPPACEAVAGLAQAPDSASSPDAVPAPVVGRAPESPAPALPTDILGGAPSESDVADAAVRVALAMEPHRPEPAAPAPAAEPSAPPARREPVFDLSDEGGPQIPRDFEAERAFFPLPEITPGERPTPPARTPGAMRRLAGVFGRLRGKGRAIPPEPQPEATAPPEVPAEPAPVLVQPVAAQPAGASPEIRGLILSALEQALALDAPGPAPWADLPDLPTGTAGEPAATTEAVPLPAPYPETLAFLAQGGLSLTIPAAKAEGPSLALRAIAVVSGRQPALAAPDGEAAAPDEVAAAA